MILRKHFETEQSVIKAEAPDLAAIRKYALRELTADEVFTGAMKLCHDRYDRTHERFTKAYLDRFAETLPGKSVMPGHDYSALPLGRFYAASVVPDSEGHHLKVSYYLPKDSPLVRQIELGVLRDVSIGFQAGRRNCDLCEKAWDFSHEHMPGQQYDGKTCTVTYCETEAHKAEAMEGSFVWLGAQPGAEAVAMAAKSGTVLINPYTNLPYTYTGYSSGTISYSFPTEPRQESKMLRFNTHEEAEAEVKRLELLPLAAEREAELQKAIAEKEPLAKDGAAYRTHLKSEILRMATSLDEARKDGATIEADQYRAILSHMENASAETLLPVLKGIEPRFNQTLGKGAGASTDVPDPDDATKTKTKSSPFGRLASGGLF